MRAGRAVRWVMRLWPLPWAGWWQTMLLLALLCTPLAAQTNETHGDPAAAALPAGWASGQLESGEFFYFRVSDPDNIFWELPTEPKQPDPVSPTDPARGVVGAAKLRPGETIGMIGAPPARTPTWRCTASLAVHSLSGRAQALWPCSAEHSRCRKPCRIPPPPRPVLAPADSRRRRSGHRRDLRLGAPCRP